MRKMPGTLVFMVVLMCLILVGCGGTSLVSDSQMKKDLVGKKFYWEDQVRNSNNQTVTRNIETTIKNTDQIKDFKVIDRKSDTKNKFDSVVVEFSIDFDNVQQSFGGFMTTKPTTVNLSREIYGRVKCEFTYRLYDQGWRIDDNAFQKLNTAILRK